MEMKIYGIKNGMKKKTESKLTPAILDSSLKIRQNHLKFDKNSLSMSFPEVFFDFLYYYNVLFFFH